MENELIPLMPAETFNFSCSPSAPCFNDCCKDLNQFLTPYDVLRLKSRFNMSSADFIKTYASYSIGPGTGLPILTLKTGYEFNFKCPLNSDSGCSVYEDRPSSCRMYPLARVVSKSRENGLMTEYYYLIEEPHCKGLGQGKQWTYSEWVANQNLEDYNQMNDLMMEIISLKNRLHPDPLDEASRRMIYQALYDIDSFRSAIFEKDILRNQPPEPKTMNAIKTDDTELLKFGFQYIRKTLFKEL